MLLPPRVEEYVTEENAVRAIDVYVNSLDMESMGFRNTTGGLRPGQPAYPPAALLKLYLYGYMNGIRSSRKLERETHRNLEVIWLMEGMRPSYKTIADFRKDNGRALKEVNRDFLEACKEFGLFGGELIGIDGSYFQGNVNKQKIYTEKKLKKILERLEKQIEEYLEEMDRADEAEASQDEDDTTLQEKLEALKERQQKHKGRLEKLRASGKKRISEVDEDARLLCKNGQTVAGYNVQIAVDEKHKLLVVCEVVDEGNDQRQLLPIAKEAQQRLEADTLEVVADKGYFNSLQIKACLETGITPFIPFRDVNAQFRMQGRYTKEDFQYNPGLDVYTCPAGAMLHRRTTYLRNDKRIFRYGSQEASCAQCTRKDACLPEKTPFRQINRWEHEHILEDHLERMTQKGREKSRIRAAITEHPFGTLKQQSGCTHFLLRGAPKVGGEIDLIMLSYNFKRALNTLGVKAFRNHCNQRLKKGVQDTKCHPQDQNYVNFFSRLSQTLAFITRFDLQTLFRHQVGFIYAFS
jgi:transposase/Holliday junction resolvase-like predicted endonuclease